MNIDGISSVLARSKDKALTSIQEFIQSGGGIDERDGRDMTMLMTACQVRAHECVRYILASGADIALRNKHGESALTFALRGRAWGIAAELVERGADVHGAIAGGDTPLIIAVLNYNGGAEPDTLIKRMLAEGADPDVRGGGGKSARDLAEILIDPSRKHLIPPA